MAKKRKKSSTKRVGGTKGKQFVSLLKTYAPVIGGVAGLIWGDKVNAKLDTAIGTKIDSKLIAAGTVGLGAALVFNKKMKNPIVGAVGGFAMGVGAKRAMKAFGIGGFYDVGPVNGFRDYKAVNGKSHKSLGNFNPGAGGMGYNSANSRASMSGNDMVYNGGSMMN